MSRELFDQVADALGGMLPVELGEPDMRWHGSGIKVGWRSAADRDGHEHYEAQYIHRPDGRPGPALEVGFHAEHRDEARNTEVLAHLTTQERTWRKRLGADATADVFLGRAKAWRRLSEVWIDFDVDEPDLALEVADRLATYVEVLEPLRRAARG